MRFGRSRGNEVMRQIVRQRATDYDLTRPSQSSSGRFGEHDETTTTVSDVPVWLFAPNEVNIDTEAGDRLGGDLQGLALPTTNVEVYDRLTHGTETYEVERIRHIPDESDRVLKMFALERRVNDDSTP